MDLFDGLLLALLVLLASYIQATAGFSFSIVLVAVGSILNLASVWSLTEFAAFLVIVNVTAALFGSTVRPDWRVVTPILIGMVPAIGLGVWALFWLGEDNVYVATIALGALTIVASIGLLVRIGVRPHPSGQGHRVITGTVAGLLGGALAAPGPPLVLTLYKEPLPLSVIRMSLLAILLAYGLIRVIFVQVAEPTDRGDLLLILLYTPMSLGGVWLANRFPPPLSDMGFRKMCFLILVFVGVLLLVDGVLLSIDHRA